MEKHQNYGIILKSKTTSQEEKEEAALQILLDSKMSDIVNFLKELPLHWKDLSLARTTKIIKMLLNKKEQNEETLQLVNQLIEFYSNKKLLKIDLETRRIKILLETKEYQQCLNLITSLIKELKKSDDKFNIINLYVYESKAYYEIKNVPRAKSSLTSARALAVSTFCPTDLQAQIDMLSGMYICDEKNYETAYSYFLEALDGFVIEKSIFCITVVRYLILSKIIGMKYNEVDTLFKRLLEKIMKTKYNASTDDVIIILLDVNKCCIERNINSYKALLQSQGHKIRDTFIEKHLFLLYDRLLEENILKIIEPYNNIYIANIGRIMDLNENIIESKLRKMILDGRVHGILDSVNRCLNLHNVQKKKKDDIKIRVLENLIEHIDKING